MEETILECCIRRNLRIPITEYWCNILDLDPQKNIVVVKLDPTENIESKTVEYRKSEDLYLTIITIYTKNKEIEKLSTAEKMGYFCLSIGDALKNIYYSEDYLEELKQRLKDIKVVDELLEIVDKWMQHDMMRERYQEKVDRMMKHYTDKILDEETEETETIPGTIAG